MIRVLVADDQNLIRQALEVYLKAEEDIQVVVTVDDGMKAITKIEELHPDIALIDLEMPGVDGLTTTQIISDRFPETKVLVLSSHDRPEYIHKAVQVGAKGYVLKTTPAEELANVIRSIHQGYFQLGPGLHEKIMPNLGKNYNFQDKNGHSLEQNLIKQLEKVKQEFQENLDLEYNKLWQELSNKIEQDTKQIRNDIQLETNVNLNDIKHEVEQGLKLFQQKVLQQTEQEWTNLKAYIEHKGLTSNFFQDQKMMRIQLIQLRESNQKFENKLTNIYRLFLFSSLIIGIMLLVVATV